jgi:hypothetical protein
MSHACRSCAEGDDELLPEYDSSPELALAALLTLMTSFPARRSPALARSILAHLRVVSQDGRLDAVLRVCADQLMSNWEAFEVLTVAGTGSLAESLPTIN